MEENNNTTVVIDIKINEQQVAERLAAVNQEMAILRTSVSTMKSHNNELLKSNEKLQSSFEAGKITLEQLTKGVDDNNRIYRENSVAIAESEAKMKQLKSEQTALSFQVAEATAGNRTYGTTLKEQGALLTELKNRYSSLDEQQRQSAGGQALLKQIEDLDAKMKGADGTMGDFQRNVGNYVGAIVKALGLVPPAAGAAATSVTGLSAAVKGLATNTALLIAIPIVAAIAAIVVAFNKVRDAIKRSEEATMTLREGMAALNPITDSLKRAMEGFANVVVKVVTGAVNGLTKAIGGVLWAAQELLNFFGADAHFGDNFIAARDAAIALQESEDEYIKKKRQNAVETAKIDRDVADLREKASDKEKYTAKERVAFLQEAIALETKKAQMQKDLAEMNLSNLQKEAERSANAAEMNDKLAEAERAVVEADKNLSDTKRTLNKQLTSLNEQLRNESVQAWKAYIEKLKEARREMGEIINMPSLQEHLKAQDEQAKKSAETIKAAWDRAGQSITDAIKNAQQEIDYLDPHAFDEFASVTDENLVNSTKKWDLFSESFKENADAIVDTASSVGDAFGSMASIYKTMANDESKSEEERAKAARNAKRWSALQIAANSGAAIAKGVASAMEKPFPGNIAAIASTLAAVLAAIAQAKALAAEGHEHGGPLGGKFIGATSGPDTMVFRGRPGELVLNAQQQRQLFDIANGGAQSGGITSALAEAISNMPAPVLVYSEFGEFTRQVQILENNSKLG